jgi:hypothetical protein
MRLFSLAFEEMTRASEGVTLGLYTANKGWGICIPAARMTAGANRPRY